jgi:hypothetical protein
MDIFKLFIYNFMSLQGLMCYKASLSDGKITRNYVLYRLSLLSGRSRINLNIRTKALKVGCLNLGLKSEVCLTNELIKRLVWVVYRNYHYLG